MGRQPVAGFSGNALLLVFHKAQIDSLYSAATTTTLRTADSEISCGAVTTTAMEGFSWSRLLASSPVLGPFPLSFVCVP